jgi:hypothetical protein
MERRNNDLDSQIIRIMHVFLNLLTRNRDFPIGMYRVGVDFRGLESTYADHRVRDTRYVSTVCPFNVSHIQHHAALPFIYLTEK